MNTFLMAVQPAAILLENVCQFYEEYYDAEMFSQVVTKCKIPFL